MNAAILNGGKSRRMGQDKAMLPINGEAIIDRLFNLLDSLFTSVTIVEADDDIYQGIGVLGGLHSALKKSAQKACFVSACDYPGINTPFIEYMKAQYEPSFDAVLPLWKGHVQSLCGIYSPSTLVIIEEQIAKKEYKLGDMLKKARVKLVRLDKKQHFYSEHLLLNMNTISEYEQYISQS